MSGSDLMIVVILDRQPRPRFISKKSRAFDSPSGQFEDTGLGGDNRHNGFYDFLRSVDGAIIGIRYSPDSESDALLSRVAESTNLRLVMQHGRLEYLLMFWAEDQKFDAELSQDQYFGDNVIYHHRNSGLFAVSFGIDLLSDAERASLRIFSKDG